MLILQHTTHSASAVATRARHISVCVCVRLQRINIVDLRRVRCVARPNAILRVAEGITPNVLEAEAVALTLARRQDASG